jgi:hypothetical protein
VLKITIQRILLVGINSNISMSKISRKLPFWMKINSGYNDFNSNPIKDMEIEFELATKTQTRNPSTGIYYKDYVTQQKFWFAVR